MDRDRYVCDDDHLWLALSGHDIEVFITNLNAMKCNPERLLPYELFSLKHRSRVMRYYAMHNRFDVVLEMLKTCHKVDNKVVSYGVRNHSKTPEFEEVWDIFKDNYDDYYCGDRELFKALISQRGKLYRSKIFTAARFGNLERLKEFKRQQLSGRVICAVIFSGNEKFLGPIKPGNSTVSIAKALCSDRLPENADIYTCEILFKYKKITQWPAHLEVSDSAVISAAKSGNLKVIARYRGELHKVVILAHALKRGHLKVLKTTDFADINLVRDTLYYSLSNMQSIEELIYLAAKCKKLHILKWMLKKFGTNIFGFNKFVQRYNNIDLNILDYLCEIGIIPKEYMLEHALKHGNLKYVKKYLNNEIVCLNQIGTNIEILDFIKRSVKHIKRGDLQGIQYSHITVQTCQWFRENKLLLEKDYDGIRHNAFKNEDINLLIWLKSIGKNLSDYKYHVIKRIKCAEWFIKELNLTKIRVEEKKIKLPVLMLFMEKDLLLYDL